MSQTGEEIREERRRLRAEYAGLFDQVESLLFRHDSVGINFETNTDEYAPGGHDPPAASELRFR